MKKVLSLFEFALSDFRWFRKKIGGTWYRIYDRDFDCGMAGGSMGWTRALKQGQEIITVEIYKS